MYDETPSSAIIFIMVIGKALTVWFEVAYISSCSGYLAPSILRKGRFTPKDTKGWQHGREHDDATHFHHDNREGDEPKHGPKANDAPMRDGMIHRILNLVAYTMHLESPTAQTSSVSHEDGSSERQTPHWLGPLDCLQHIVMSTYSFEPDEQVAEEGRVCHNAAKGGIHKGPAKCHRGHNQGFSCHWQTLWRHGGRMQGVNNHLTVPIEPLIVQEEGHEI